MFYQVKDSNFKEYYKEKLTDRVIEPNIAEAF